MSQIKKKEAEGVKRMNVNLPTDLHNQFKAAAAAQGLEMTTLILQFVESYVAKHGQAPQKKGRRG